MEKITFKEHQEILEQNMQYQFEVGFMQGIQEGIQQGQKRVIEIITYFKNKASNNELFASGKGYNLVCFSILDIVLQQIQEEKKQ